MTNIEVRGLREQAGQALGRAWAAPIAAISAIRHARTFHPRGVLFTGRVEPARGSRFPELGFRLEGPALVRLSGALSKKDVERFEVLGIGLRISHRPIPNALPVEGDQDLLFATIRSPVTMPLAPFTTRSDDFLANRYFAVAPFRIEGVGRVKLRLSPIAPPPRGSQRRDDELRTAVATDHARFALELRRTLHTGWEQVATLVLEQPSPIDQEALRFDPFRTGRGIVPVGFVHAIRKHVYAASQAARPVHAFT